MRLIESYDLSESRTKRIQPLKQLTRKGCTFPYKTYDVGADNTFGTYHNFTIYDNSFEVLSAEHNFNRYYGGRPNPYYDEDELEEQLERTYHILNYLHLRTPEMQESWSKPEYVMNRLCEWLNSHSVFNINQEHLQHLINNYWNKEVFTEQEIFDRYAKQRNWVKTDSNILFDFGTHLAIDQKLHKNRRLFQDILYRIENNQIITMSALGVHQKTNEWYHIKKIIDDINNCSDIPTRKDVIERYRRIQEYIDSITYIPSINDIQREIGSNKATIRKALDFLLSGDSYYTQEIDVIKDEVKYRIDYPMSYNTTSTDNRIILNPINTTYTYNTKS